MSKLIAFSGKGGVGKTTLASVMVRRLRDKGKTPVLAIDADPNSCLDALLGVTVEDSIGEARENVREEAEVMKISKQELLRMKIAQCLVESEGFDLIAMGRPEGAGCYCYANSVLKDAIKELSDQYPYVVLDNEAGLENLSRRIVQDLDVLFLVSDGSNAGIRTLMRLYDLAKEMEVKFGRLYLVINRTREGYSDAAAQEAKEYTGADGLILLPYDGEVVKVAEEDGTVWEMPDGNGVLGAFDDIIDSL